jgi:hypothetical protein
LHIEETDQYIVDSRMKPSLPHHQNDRSSSHQQNPPSIYDLHYLRRQTRWIRDDLDPVIARSGPDSLHTDDVLRLDEFLRRLLTSNLSLDDIRDSRLHLAIECITGKATRWPGKIIERADAVREVWEAKYGSLKGIGILLFGPGGRLEEVERFAEDSSWEVVVGRWMRQPGVRLNPLEARRAGDLGFKPGECVWLAFDHAVRRSFG